MLSYCALDFFESWSQYLHLMEFSYNNSYRSTSGITPFEMLYGRKCGSPLHWDEVGEKQILGAIAVREANEAIEMILQWMLLKAGERARLTLREGTSSFQLVSLCS